jgi:hypothetical protein
VGTIVKVIRPRAPEVEGTEGSFTGSFDFVPYVSDLYQAVYPRLQVRHCVV